MRPAKRVAGQKTASRNFFRAPSKPRRETAPQVSGTHLESRSYRYVFVSGCVVAPNNAVDTALMNIGMAMGVQVASTQDDLALAALINSNKKVVLSIKTQATGTQSGLPVGTHSWLEVRVFDGNKLVATQTFATYGNENGAQHVRGLNVNTELTPGRYDATQGRATTLDRDQIVSLFTYIDSTKAQGSNAWALSNSCAGFASTGWNLVTGETLTDTQAGSRGYPTPRGLGNGLNQLNGGTDWGVKH